MTIRAITPPPGEDWSKWHAARDIEVRADERAKVLDPIRECLIAASEAESPRDMLDEVGGALLHIAMVHSI